MQNFQDNLDRYFRNEMEASEKIEFETLVNSDVGLVHEFNIQKEIYQIIKVGNLKMTLSEISKQKTNSKIIKFSTMKKLYSGIAALLVIGLGIFWLNKSNHGTSQLFDKYYEVDEGLPTLMGGGPDGYSFDDAMVDYKNKQYKKAASKFAFVIKNEKKSDTLNYYYGLSLLASDQYLLAQDQFMGISDNSSFYEKAQWYLALAFIRHEDNKEAKKVLSGIQARKNGPYSQKAQELLAAID